MHPTKTAPAVAVLLLACSAALAQDAAPTAAKPPELGPDTRDFDMRHLDLSLDLDMQAGSLRGTATHRMTSLADGLARVRLHLKDMQVESAEADGAACKVTHENGILTLELDRPRALGEEFTLRIAYGGTPHSGLWFFRPTDAHPGIPLQAWSQGQGTNNRHWIPLYDLPDDRLTSNMTVTVPAGLTTLSNGRPTRTEPAREGFETHGWSLEREHPPYLITLVVGTFEDKVRDAAGVEQHDLVPPGWGDWVDEVFGRTPDMMGFFQEFTGEPYPWGRYSQVTVWDFQWGGMENTGATTLNMRALHKDGVRPDYAADGLVAHELAHMWFGDVITCRTWNHIWLNEGFATYFTDLWVEHHHGRDDFRAARRDSRDRYMGSVDLAKLSVRPLPAHPTDCGDVQSKPYVKGSSVLHMLRGLVGDDAFRNAIRRYVAACKDRSVETEELRAAFEREVGRDFGWFFQQWVYGNGYPELTVRSEWRESDGAVEMRVLQTQPITPTMPVFRTPVDVEVTWPDGTVERRRHEIHRASHTWRIPGPGKPKLVRFDPEDWLLARVTEIATREKWEARLADDPDFMGRVIACRALATQGENAAGALAKAATGDASRFVRGEACTALGKLGGERAGAALSLAAQDADSRVRTDALTALGEIPAAWSGEALTRALASDPSYYAAAAAAASLGKTQAPGAFAALEAGLARGSHRDRIRQEIMNGLKELKDPRGAVLARRYLGYELGGGIQHRMRHAALDAMVALAPDAPETRAAVVALIDDPYFRMRIWAAGHAAKLGIRDAVPVLQRVAKTAGDGPGVKAALRKAIEQLAKTSKSTDAERAASEDTDRATRRAAIEKRLKGVREELERLEKELAALK